MKIKTISYGKTFQVKQYEPERVDATAELEIGEDPVEAMKELKTFVLENSLTAKKVRAAKTIAKRKAELEAELEELEDQDEEDLFDGDCLG